MTTMRKPGRSKYAGQDLPLDFQEVEGREVFRIRDRWTLRLVRQGETYGRCECLEHKSDRPLVEVYDAEADPARFGPLGQFVSRYYVDTLTGADEMTPRYGPPISRTGINLDGGVPRWTMNASDAALMMAWLAGLGFPEVATDDTPTHPWLK